MTKTKSSQSPVPATLSLEEIAYHEAGHFVVAYLLDISMISISIQPNGDGLGHVKPRSRRKIRYRFLRFDRRTDSFKINHDIGAGNRDRLMKMIMMSLAGGIAQCEFTGHSLGADDDLSRAIAAARLVTLSSEVAEQDQDQTYIWADYFAPGSLEANALIDWLTIRTRRLIQFEKHWQMIERLAKALLERKTLRADEAIDVIAPLPSDRCLGPAERTHN